MEVPYAHRCSANQEGTWTAVYFPDKSCWLLTRVTGATLPTLMPIAFCPFCGAALVVPVEAAPTLQDV